MLVKNTGTPVATVAVALITGLMATLWLALMQGNRRKEMMPMRHSVAPLTIVATCPRIIPVLAASVAGCVALLWAYVVLGASTASAASTTYTVKDLGTL